MQTNRTFKVKGRNVVQTPRNTKLTLTSQNDIAQATLDIVLSLHGMNDHVLAIVHKADPGSDYFHIVWEINWTSRETYRVKEEIRITTAFNSIDGIIEWLLIKNWDDDIRETVLSEEFVRDYYECGRFIRQVVKDIVDQLQSLRNRLICEERERRELLEKAFKDIDPNIEIMGSQLLTITPDSIEPAVPEE